MLRAAPDTAARSKFLLDTAVKLLEPHAHGPVTRRDWNLVFQDVYSLCVSTVPKTKELYAMLNDTMTKHVRAIRTNIEQQQSDVLQAVDRAFVQYHRGAELIACAFNYMDRELAPKSASEPQFPNYAEKPPLELKALAMQVWKVELFAPLKDRIIHNALRAIRAARDNEGGSLDHVRGVLFSIVKMAEKEDAPLEPYIKHFEEQFLQETAEFYERESTQFLQEHDCASYMVKAVSRLREEEERGRRILHPSTHPKLIQTCEDKLIQTHQGVLQAECERFICNKQVPDLHRMYELLKRVNEGVNPMLHVFEAFVKSEGQKKIATLEANDKSMTPAQYFEAMTELHQEVAGLTSEAFSSDPVFLMALDKGCRAVVNIKRPGAHSSPAPELLCKFCDSILRKKSKVGSEAEMDELLDKTVTIFKYIDDKDVFQKFYSKTLAKRLIHGTSISEEAEMGMINRLSTLCGVDFTAKFQRMFTDITLSTDLNSQFQESEFGNALDFGFRVLVLQTGAWPLGQTAASEFHIPRELEASIHGFEKFYDKRFTGRKLNWLHHLAQADIKGRFRARTYEFTVTTYQMAVLLLFNGADSVIVQQVQEATNLNERELDRTLRSLIVCHLLKPRDAISETAAELQLDFNEKYSNKYKHKIKISAAVQRDTPQEVQATREAVDDDRKLFLQAAIVRIMKMRRTLPYNLLIREVIDQAAARFQPSVSYIKKCIEQLIDKQYLQRSEEDKSMMMYVA